MVKNEKEGILLESGTNEIEVMKFTVMGEFYGINVAKVQEIIMSEKVKPMPSLLFYQLSYAFKSIFDSSVMEIPLSMDRLRI